MVNDAAEPTVLAGGGVVADADGNILLVHRPRYDDWSLPKGKLDPGETVEACALREVHEEAGLVCALGAEVASVHYVDRKGRDKLVRYWAMTVLDGTFAPNDEVDAIEWVSPDTAGTMLTYPRDLDVIRSASSHR